MKDQISATVLDDNDAAGEELTHPLLVAEQENQQADELEAQRQLMPGQRQWLLEYPDEVLQIIFNEYITPLEIAIMLPISKAFAEKLTTLSPVSVLKYELIKKSLSVADHYATIAMTYASPETGPSVYEIEEREKIKKETQTALMQGNPFTLFKVKAKIFKNNIGLLCCGLLYFAILYGGFALGLIGTIKSKGSDALDLGLTIALGILNPLITYCCYQIPWTSDIKLINEIGQLQRELERSNNSITQDQPLLAELQRRDFINF